MLTECTCPQGQRRALAAALDVFHLLSCEQQVTLLRDLMRVLAGERDQLLAERDRLLQETRSQREELAGLRARLRVLTEF